MNTTNFATKYNYEITDFIKSEFNPDLSCLDYFNIDPLFKDNELKDVGTLGDLILTKEEALILQNFSWFTFIERMKMDLEYFGQQHNDYKAGVSQFVGSKELNNHEWFRKYVDYRLCRHPLTTFYSTLAECVNALALHKVGLLEQYYPLTGFQKQRPTNQIDFKPDPSKSIDPLRAFDSKIAFHGIGKFGVDGPKLASLRNGKKDCDFYLINYFMLGETKKIYEMNATFKVLLNHAAKAPGAAPCLDVDHAEAIDKCMHFHISHFEACSKPFLNEQRVKGFRTVHLSKAYILDESNHKINAYTSGSSKRFSTVVEYKL